jgi:hypothetical protein
MLTRKKLLTMSAVAVAGGTAATAETFSTDGAALLDKHFVSGPPSIGISAPASWFRHDVLLTDVLDPWQLFGITSKPAVAHVSVDGGPNFSRMPAGTSVLLAYGERLKPWQNRSQYRSLASGVRLADFNGGIPDSGADGALAYEQYYMFGDYGIQIFAWAARGGAGDQATLAAMVGSIRASG